LCNSRWALVEHLAENVGVGDISDRRAAPLPLQRVYEVPVLGEVGLEDVGNPLHLAL
jgi:hypothetical protein